MLIQSQDPVDFYASPEFFSNFESCFLTVKISGRAEQGYYPRGVPDMVQLSSEAEKDLFLKYSSRRTKKTRELLVRKYLCWSFKLATKMCGPRLEPDDAISAANVGLMEAIETFDANRGTRFTTHSYLIIRRHLIEALVGTYPVHVSQHVRKKMKAAPISSAPAEIDEDPRSLDELFSRLGEGSVFEIAEMFERPDEVTSVGSSPEHPAELVDRNMILPAIRLFVDTKLTGLERKVFTARHYRDPAVPFEILCTRLKTTKFAVREAYRSALKKVQKKFN
jgi:RNA polymerase sigma factor (sigma-70 family)